MDELKDFQKIVIKNARSAKGLKVGDYAPDFRLPNVIGRFVTLSELLQRGSVVLKFYRGEWCPICNLDLRAIQKVLPKIKSQNASVVAISPQNPDNAMSMQEKNNLGFEVLSDIDQKVIKRYKLQFNPGKEYIKRRNLRLLNGDSSVLMPIPATFIINQNSKINFAHVDADYTKRMDAYKILELLNTITTK